MLLRGREELEEGELHLICLDNLFEVERIEKKNTFHTMPYFKVEQTEPFTQIKGGSLMFN